MRDIDRASRAVAAAVETGLPVWIGTSCALFADGSVGAWNKRMEEPADRLAPDDHRKESKPFASLIEAMMSFEPQVMGVMHSTIETTGPGLKALFERWNGPVMAYPETSSQIRRGIAGAVEPSVFAEHCRDWVERGVQIIGGCCGTTVDHIRAMVKELPDAIGGRS